MKTFLNDAIQLQIKTPFRYLVLVLCSSLLVTSSTIKDLNATEYKFHVSCQSHSFITQWNTGTIDPGREYLRVITGTKNPNCSVSNYSPSIHKGLDVERLSDGGGVMQGIPGAGLLCAVFNC